jgi:hypothetical protein
MSIDKQAIREFIDGLKVACALVIPYDEPRS